MLERKKITNELEQTFGYRSVALIPHAWWKANAYINNIIFIHFYFSLLNVGTLRLCKRSIHIIILKIIFGIYTRCQQIKNCWHYGKFECQKVCILRPNWDHAVAKKVSIDVIHA